LGKYIVDIWWLWELDHDGNTSSNFALRCDNRGNGIRDARSSVCTPAASFNQLDAGFGF
jgi:hypothetical protein